VIQAGPALSRRLNEQAVIDVVIANGTASRVDIARATGLSKQTVSDIMASLEDEGWIQEAGRTHGAIGRSAVMYRLRSDAAYVVGVDLGGTKVRVAVADLTGQIVAEDVVATNQAGGLGLIDEIVDLAQELARRAEAEWRRVLVTAIGSPGVPNPQTGAMDFAPNIPSFGDLQVHDQFARRVGHTLLLDNDVNMAVRGEQWQGHGRTVRDFVFIAVGTGIGMGIVADGDIRRGAHGAAGEIGYLPLGADPFDPANQVHGALEEAVAGATVAARYQAATGEHLDVPAVFERANAGDAHALAAIEDEARLIGLAIATVTAVLDPDLVILGGGVGSRPELLEPVRRWTRNLRRQHPEVLTSGLGHRASLVGAIAAALTEAHRTLFAAPVEDSLTLPVPAGGPSVRSAPAPTVAGSQ
jgi:predicted NBD/HSP70 family sugar kinase